MIVVAIIGILAAIAIPQYSQYIYRSKRAEALGMLGSIKVAEETYRATRDCYAPLAPNPPGLAQPTRRAWDFSQTVPPNRPCSDTTNRSFEDLNVRPASSLMYYTYACVTRWNGTSGQTEEYACSMIGDLDGDGPSEIVYCTDNDADGVCINSVTGIASSFPYDPQRVTANAW
jgi:Tfp pilus assembly protein PilE